MDIVDVTWHIDGVRDYHLEELSEARSLSDHKQMFWTFVYDGMCPEVSITFRTWDLFGYAIFSRITLLAVKMSTLRIEVITSFRGINRTSISKPISEY